MEDGAGLLLEGSAAALVSKLEAELVPPRPQRAPSGVAVYV